MKNTRINKKKLLLVFFVAFSLRIGIASIPPLLPVLQKDLGISEVQGSLLTSIPVICMGIFAFLVPSVQKRIGRRNGVLFFLLLLTVGIGLRVIATNYVGLVGTAFFIGIGTAIIGPLLSGYIKQEFPQKTGLMIGVYSISMGTGAAISSGSVSSLTKFFNGHWNNALAFFALFGFIGLISWSYGTKNSFEKTGERQHFFLPLKNKQAWKVTLFFGLQSGIFYGITTWISSIAFQRGVSIETASFILTFYTIMQMCFSFIIPMLMDYRGTIKNWSLFSSTVAFIGTSMLLMEGPLFLFILAVLFLAIGLGGLFPIALLLPIQLTNSAEEASAWTGMVQSVGYMIGGIIPILMGVATDYVPIKNSSLWFVFLLAMLLIGLGSKIYNKK